MRHAKPALCVNTREVKHKVLSARKSHVGEVIECSRRHDIDARTPAGSEPRAQPVLLDRRETPLPGDPDRRAGRGYYAV
jgi:hypothetical protein